MTLMAIEVNKGDSIFVDGNWHKVEKINRKENHKTWGECIFFNELHPVFTYQSIPAKRALAKKY